MAAIPDEIIQTILLKLPIKSLFRFKSVSKLWNSMISDFRFVRTHYQLSMNSADSDNLFLTNVWPDNGLSLVRFEAKNFKIEAPVWRPVGWQSSKLLCSGDGLILLVIDESCDPSGPYMLYNPRTRQHTILRFPYYVEDEDEDDSWVMYGVCYDPVNEDVKVVIAYQDFYTVYSCKNRSWAEKKKFPYKIDDPEFDGGLSVDGAVYWKCYKKDERRIIVCFDDERRIIVCFDSKDDSFKILQKPEDLKDDQAFQYLKARKARLYLCCYVEDEKTVKIWIKKKGECSWKLWKVLVNIETFFRSIACIEMASIEIVTENEIIICFLLRRTNYIYNCCDKSYRKCLDNFDFWRSGLHPFVDSMFSPFLKRESTRKRKLSNA